jgi:assimilatory nitrate reductase catalytic subunit
MTAAEPLSPVRTTCPYCGVGCGVLASVRDARVEIHGDPEHPANLGRLCSKGSALGETLTIEGRLLRPRVRDGQGAWQEAGWDRALTQVAAGFARTIAEHGPNAVAFYVSGQLLTEDYYAANKLMKGFIGSGNIDTNSRLCMSSAVAGHMRAFGEDVVPCSYRDVELADLVVLVGSNTAWCHPVLYQRLVAARETRPQMKVVVIDPRRTPTCDIADLHLPVHGGSDVRLFNGLLHYLSQTGAQDHAFVGQHTEGLQAALAIAAEAGDVEAVAGASGIAPTTLQEFFRLFATSPRVVTLFSQGVNQSSSGTDKVNSIINCHLFTGQIGRPGCGPFSITGQPNAMGGREVGGLATTLAAHLRFDCPEHREWLAEFWEAPQVASRPGLKAVDLFAAIGRGEIKAVWIMATNPVVSLPEAEAAREALRRCDLVVVSDCMADTDTTALAHVCLPAAAWGEKDGTVTNSERVISRQRAFRAAPGECKPDWWIICEVAKRLGFAAQFGYRSAYEIFAEHTRLSMLNVASSGPGRRMFSLDMYQTLDEPGYEQLSPRQWPSSNADSPFARGDFPTPSRRARFVATPIRAPAHAASETYPFILNTGRIRDQWHTMTRTGQSPRLTGHRPEPHVDVHPQDALLMGVRNAELARVRTHWGAILVRVRSTDEQRRGTLFVPIHWSSPYAADARVGTLVNPVVDPISGEPEFKHTPATLEPFPVDWYGFALTRGTFHKDAFTYWAQLRGAEHQRVEFAGRGQLDWKEWRRRYLPGKGHWIEYLDHADGTYRAARVADGRLEACVFVSRQATLPDREWLGTLFAKAQVDESERFALLAGRPSDQADAGPIVCACFGVGRNVLQQAIRRQPQCTPRRLGTELKAGTNCGSCIPELRRLIAAVAEEAQDGTAQSA